MSAHPVVAPLAEKVLRATLALAAVLALLAGCDAAVSTPTDETGSDGADARGSGAEGADTGEDPEPPNIVVIPTDDLAAGDLTPATLEQMPNLKSLMDKGTTFENGTWTNRYGGRYVSACETSLR